MGFLELLYVVAQTAWNIGLQNIVPGRRPQPIPEPETEEEELAEYPGYGYGAYL